MRVWLRRFVWAELSVAILAAAASASAQEVPSEYKAVLSVLGKTGDFKDGVLKVNIPRTDLRVSIKQRSAPTPFGFGGWVAFTKGDEGHEVMRGDLVLTEDEVNPVMSAILGNGLEVTALHNHFFWEQPRVFYMHVHGMGTAAEIAKKLQPAIRLIDAAVKRAPPATTGAPAASIAGAPLAGVGLPWCTLGTALLLAPLWAVWMTLILQLAAPRS